MIIDLSLTSFATVGVLLAVSTVLNIKSGNNAPLRVFTHLLIWGCLLLMTLMTVALVVSP